MASEDSIWIFGYASLIWKPNIEYLQKKRGKVRGYMRRFWQESTDHRGVPGAPGRVATLVKSEGGEVWGYAFEISGNTKKKVFADLAVREKCGYELVGVSFYSESGEEIKAQCYMGTENNPEFLSYEEIQHTAEVITKSSGHSGTNREYLEKLVVAVKEVFPEENDEYLNALSEMVREMV
ncbi:Glutathione-specific gamma-glutamylcyclotransferase 2 [Oopsacas minuta]|uniref:glutathione-specific gamma-glutamylcyclotransferase n=1 Tax=Oopsacas minuta TaxID=111878 RepID=A0AAV7K196_9METZ|nr:Glutathione-specific gamma-glutamylcyclotransferase 2 [Oopsacas minuta]